FRAHQVDTSGASLYSTAQSIQKENPGVKVLNIPSISLNNFRFNMKFKPFQDVRVRQAISLATDRQQFLDLFSEGRGAVSGPITPIFKDVANTTDWLMQQPGYRKDKTQDIAQAKSLLK